MKILDPLAGLFNLFKLSLKDKTIKKLFLTLNLVVIRYSADTDNWLFAYLSEKPQPNNFLSSDSIRSA